MIWCIIAGVIFTAAVACRISYAFGYSTGWFDHGDYINRRLYEDRVHDGSAR